MSRRGSWGGAGAEKGREEVVRDIFEQGRRMRGRWRTEPCPPGQEAVAQVPLHKSRGCVTSGRLRKRGQLLSGPFPFATGPQIPCGYVGIINMAYILQSRKQRPERSRGSHKATQLAGT